ncbi:hypothetical protein WR25_01706 [Diploscapter pachys]|uniref:EGF-like domain-containing protein n=1 Tax=Diploscapter pachys TaxID=2018661 RepID=A0A2A2JSI4_9BILA|nr:hypothetical protein WR25_01706 [Diploscapter pachys]
MRRFLLLFLLALCSSRIIYAQSSTTESSTTPNEGGDSTTPNGGGDSTTPNEGGDSTTPNGGGDSTTPNEGGDSTTPNGGGDSTTSFTGSPTSPNALEGSSTPANTQPPAGSSALPVTGQPQTAKPMDLTTHIMMNDDFTPMDDKAILQQAANLNAEVLSLINEVKSLQANVDPVNSPYFAQLTQIQNNATQLNTTVGVLLQNVTQANATYGSLMANYTQTIGWFNCFAGSNCVPTPTTTAGTTTTPKWASCPTDNKRNVTNTISGEYNLKPSGPFLDCSTEIDGVGGEKVIVAVKSLTFDMTGYLRFYDIPGARYVKNYTTNVNTTQDEIKTDSTQIRVEFGTGWSSSDLMSFDITYRAENSCDDYVCPGSLNNSHCVLTLSGQPYCVCNDPCAMNGTDVCDTSS